MSLQQLRSRHREIARLRHQGVEPKEIAARLDMSVATLYQIFADPLFKAHVDSLEDASDKATISARKILADGAVRAAGRIVDMVETPDEKVALSAAKDVLDRTGYAAQTANFHAHLHMNSDDITRLKERARELGIIASKEDTPNDERDLTKDLDGTYQ